MKILVFSDSHGSTRKMEEIIKNNTDVQTIIHLGDTVKDAGYLEKIFVHLNFIYVAGNNDWLSDEPTEKLIELMGKRIFVTHGNAYSVKFGKDTLVDRGRRLEADIVLFGHTHAPHEEYIGKMLIVNPGSISLPARGERCSYCELCIENGEIKSRLIQGG